MIAEYQRKGIENQLLATINHLEAVSSNPGHLEIAQNFQTQVKALKAILMTSAFNTPRPTQAMLLDTIGAREFVGERLFKRIEDLIQQNSMAPHHAALRLRELNSNIAGFYNHLATIDASFTALDVEYEDIEPGEGELAISIPEPTRPRLLSDLAATAKAWNQALSPFVELADPEHNPIEVRTISSSDWQFYLSAAPQVLLAISAVVYQVNELLAQLVETKRLLSQLVSTGISEDATNVISSEADRRMDDRSREIAEQLVESNQPADEGRANELKISISRSVKFIAREMAENVSIEVRYIPPDRSEGPSNEENEIARIDALAATAERIAQNMSFVPLDGTAAKLLNLPAPPDPD